MTYKDNNTGMHTNEKIHLDEISLYVLYDAGIISYFIPRMMLSKLHSGHCKSFSMKNIDR